MKKSALFLILLIIIVIGTVSLTNSASKRIPYTQNINTKNSNVIGNSISNMYNGGIACEQGEYIYYSDFGDMYIQAKGESRPYKIATGQIGCINVVGDWIYYIESYPQNNRRMSSLCKIKINGEDKQSLIENVVSLRVINNCMYYIKDDFLYKNNTDGTNEKLLLNNEVASFNIMDNTIYYAEEKLDSNGITYYPDEKFIVYKANIDGTNKTKLFEKHGNASFIVYNDWIYYIESKDENTDNSYLYRIKTDGSQKSQVSNDTVRTMNIYKDFIYYVKIADSFLYQSNLDGTKEKLIIPMDTDEPNIVADKIYCSITETDGNSSSADMNIVNIDGTGKKKIETPLNPDNIIKMLLDILDAAMN